MATRRALAFLLLVQAAPVDLAKELGSSDPSARLTAVKVIAEKGHPEAEKLLLKALGDEDWEVATIAARTLGVLRVQKAEKPLLDLAVEAPVRGLRRAAGEALASIDAVEAYEKLQKQLGDETKVRACQAIEALGPGLAAKEPKTKELERLLEDRDAGAKRAAARALVALAGPQRVARLKGFLAHEDTALRAGVIEAAGASNDPAVFEPLARLFEGQGLPDFLARRTYVVLRALQQTHPERKGDFAAVLTDVAKSQTAAGHVARLLGWLGEERQGQRALDPGEALDALAPYLKHAQAATRATAAAACGRIGSEAALDAAAKLAQGDADARVRRIALGIVARARGAKHDGARALLLERLAKDADARVRETAASYLGVRGKTDVISVLEAALSDPDWRVVTSAAVSLGKTEQEQGAGPLILLYQKGADWRARASAVAGLTRLRTRTAVPILIAALEDSEALVARTAYEFLCEIARERLEPKPAVWTKWWEERGDKIRLSIPEEVLERRKKLEYAQKAPRIEELFQGTYVGIDVLVLQTQPGGDAIQDVLADMKIEHRITVSGQILAEGLHPLGVFVSNCPGEITSDEAERLSWFVRAGGALFGSCWALQETIEKIEPGLVRKLETRGEVLDDVAAYPVDQESRFLQGVFTTDGRPIYHLEGAHLIEVLDPEEVEVLVDSPQCAARYGGANLAAWFRLGHGIVLDSANHFEGQGFVSASNVREPAERMAWAVDHFGLTYEKLRELRKEKFWSKTSSTSEHVKDLSVFRLITNFVWLKRLAEE